ncbi:hypothetical protein Bcav_2515 [Beutenbergia cavernae DSM 12333]|uniref:Uncharacterized protein n=1 Tax=Beutenbergia cavernae (strain ATCC BAA-8 / DSM 12333 / CCUG 43141 / JCM 11478 / NBRC 16432 / NCIMB 13614 / HKI 0122) TaxID=471853 RepID=C5BWU8_BEUC1|nr:hypothetical protein [Beutenbergia cavernae]ACQ80764.1 hypothetical protein Bcav_2515 [Beutenbergia cavernae DSM 12333]
MSRYGARRRPTQAERIAAQRLADSSAAWHAHAARVAHDAATVETWADGYGTWHARVTVPTAHAGYARGIARDAIDGEIATRQADAAPACRVERLESTTAHGRTTAHYVEADQ